MLVLVGVLFESKAHSDCLAAWIESGHCSTMYVFEPLFVELAVTTAGCSHRVGDPS